MGLKIDWKDNPAPVGGTELTIDVDGRTYETPDGTAIKGKHYLADQLEEARKVVQKAVDQATFVNAPDTRGKV
jgi:hypothetical protein